MTTFSHHSVSRVVGGIFSFLSKPQKKALLVFVTGLCKARSGIITEVARKTQGAEDLRYQLSAEDHGCQPVGECRN